MFLAIKELRRNKGRYALIMGILTMLIFLVLFITGLTRGLGSATSSAIKNSPADAYLLSDDADDLITRSSLTQDQLDVVSSEFVTPVNLQRMTFQRSSNDAKVDITYMAIDPMSFMMPNAKDVSDLGKHEILLDESFMAKDVSVGDTIVDTSSNVSLKVVGFVKGYMYGHSSIGILSQDSFQGMLQEVTHAPSPKYNAFAIKGDSIPNLDATVVRTQVEIIAKIPGHAQEQSTLTMILVVLLGISGIILGTFFYVTTLQKLPQFGVLKALGATTGMVGMTIVSQVGMLAGLSMLIGNGLTFAMAVFLPKSMPFTLSVRDALVVSLVFFVIAIVSSLFSLRKVATVDPLMAIGGNE
ncbi:ABC transporter permease [Erysipelothrix sp. HDW6C]|uniref:ABC transporter permease n=1 Tax=Erysipelothrix sp. HDW6C TaxID=2714930 RepID=UPI00140DF1C9|nr:ABC transporter permease [Erysipelothrix sp. HDW6C]QIK68799.1 ABC transporter permease [Erysipelothrix sp. HDW6C]